MNVQKRGIVGIRQAAVGCNPGIKQATGFERGFQSSTLVRLDMRSEIDELP